MNDKDDITSKLGVLQSCPYTYQRGKEDEVLEIKEIAKTAKNEILDLRYRVQQLEWEMESVSDDVRFAREHLNNS